ncbi:MAG: two-component regulator propeller domain-containing protein [Bacteroidota bacterium]
MKFQLFFLFPLLALFLIISCSKAEKSAPIQETITSPLPSLTIPTKIDTSSFLAFSSGIRSILEDRMGNIWFASNGEGVAKFDGKQFSYFNRASGLSHWQVRNMYEDEAGRIWIEGGKGISQYDGLRFIPIEERNFKDRDNWKLGEHDLWFKGDEMTGYNKSEGQAGVYQYNGKELFFRAFPILSGEGEENYYSVTTPPVQGKNGEVWFGTYGAAIGFDNQRFRVINNRFLGLSKETGFLHIRGLFVDSHNNLWIANNGIGVFKYDGKEISHFTKEQKVSKADREGNHLDRVFSVGEDIEGNIWFGTVYSGVWKYDGQSLINYDEDDGLPCQHIWNIYQSNRGELWFCGDEPSGVYVFNGTTFERKF